MAKSIYFVSFIVISLALIGGQLLRVSIGGGAITALDVVVIGWLVIWLVDLLISRRRYHFPPVGRWAILFIALAALSLIAAWRYLTPAEILISGSYLARWIAYASLIYMGYALARSEKLIPALGAVFGAVALLGIVQLAIFPDLRFLEQFGWDPHQSRLVSTFLDPNFVGGFLVIGLSLALTQWLVHRSSALRWYWSSIAVLTLGSIYLTFSRSALLALLVAAGVMFVLRSRLVGLALLAVSVLVFLLVPRWQGRVQGAFEMDQTARYRIESWQEGWNIIRHEPLIGVGFNTLSFTRERYGKQPIGHSASGFDSSLLTVGATTGGLGLLAYLGLLAGSVLLAWRKWRAKSAPVALAFLMATTALLAHSVFVNSLFYPSVLVVWWIILGLVWAV